MHHTSDFRSFGKLLQTKIKERQNKNQKYYGKTRFVVERFFAWQKCGFHRTTIIDIEIVIIKLDLFTWHQF